jgi:hypothetical protein
MALQQPHPELTIEPTETQAAAYIDCVHYAALSIKALDLACGSNYGLRNPAVLATMISVMAQRDAQRIEDKRKGNVAPIKSLPPDNARNASSKVPQQRDR